MEPRIKNLSSRVLAGKSLTMTLNQNRTPELWKSFMPLLKSISQTEGKVLYSMQIYDEDFRSFTMDTVFTKWAAIEVETDSELPEGIEPYYLQGGLYAVFDYKGRPEDFSETFQKIFHVWLPSSDYILDDREHFELLGEKYRNNDPESEEEIWIPVQLKSK